LLKRQILVYEEWYVTSLIIEEGVCRGVVAWDLLHGGLQAIGAKAVLLATGGSGRVFLTSTNAVINTGDGMALAYRAGAPLEDMEFVQFHPTTLKDTGILITEGARGEGGYLLNTLGDRFMKAYAPEQMELATRSTVSLAIGQEITEGRGVDGYVREVAPRALSDAALRSDEARVKRLMANKGAERAWQVRDELGKTMAFNLGIFRTQKSMTEAFEKVRELMERAPLVFVQDRGKV